MLYDQIAAFIAETRRQLAEANADGNLSFSELFHLFVDGVERLVAEAQKLSIPGADKKAAVLEAVGQLYDQVLAPIDIPYIPEFIESSVVDPALKKLALAAADGLIEKFVKALPE